MLAKSKFFNKNQPSTQLLTPITGYILYIQASKGNIKEIIKIKNAFLKLSSDKVMEIYNIMNNTNQKGKQKFNIITKGPSRKQIIIPMSTNNSERVIAQASNHISNINRLLKGVKSRIFTDYIQSGNKGIVIITNKVVAFSNLKIVEKYIKELNNVNSNDIISLRLP